MLRVLLAAFHLIALGLGMGAVITRGNALREPVSPGSLQRAFRADTLWGIAAALWIATGLWRLLGQTEKTTDYYTHNSFFIAKMCLFALIFVLEIQPMLTLIKWRRALRSSARTADIVSPAAARRIAMVSHLQALLLVLMVFAATAMARGFGI